MTTIKKRGRPRSLDVNEATIIAMHLFWERGYETVGIADLTKAMNIKPPSLYAAFGNKAGLFQKVLERYQAQEGKKFKPAFSAQTKEEFVKKLFSIAADSYTKHASYKGCLVLEGTKNTSDLAAIEISKNHIQSTHDMLSITLKNLGARDHLLIADTCVTALLGLSGYAKNGVSAARLQKVAIKMAGNIFQ